MTQQSHLATASLSRLHDHTQTRHIR